MTRYTIAPSKQFLQITASINKLEISDLYIDIEQNVAAIKVLSNVQNYGEIKLNNIIWSNHKGRLLASGSGFCTLSSNGKIEKRTVTLSGSPNPITIESMRLAEAAVLIGDKISLAYPIHTGTKLHFVEEYDMGSMEIIPAVKGSGTARLEHADSTSAMFILNKESAQLQFDRPVILHAEWLIDIKQSAKNVYIRLDQATFDLQSNITMEGSGDIITASKKIHMIDPHGKGGGLSDQHTHILFQPGEKYKGFSLPSGAIFYGGTLSIKDGEPTINIASTALPIVESGVRSVWQYTHPTQPKQTISNLYFKQNRADQPLIHFETLYSGELILDKIHFEERSKITKKDGTYRTEGMTIFAQTTKELTMRITNSIVDVGTEGGSLIEYSMPNKADNQKLYLDTIQVRLINSVNQVAPSAIVLASMQNDILDNQATLLIYANEIKDVSRLSWGTSNRLGIATLTEGASNKGKPYAHIIDHKNCTTVSYSGNWSGNLHGLIEIKPTI